MAITVNWLTKVIYVPKADLTLIQASPEIRELDLNWFRLQLKAIEAAEQGIGHFDTHRHTSETTLAGLTYARIIEMINGYTIEFEDGQYTVNCVGANHNVSDVKVANQVSLIVNNAAGLITNTAIEYSSYNGGVTVDVTSSYTGTTFPIGTPQRPVNNMADALVIANTRGFTRIFIMGDITLGDSGDYSNLEFEGESTNKTLITIQANANVTNCEFYNAFVRGTLDGNNVLIGCAVDNLTYVYGELQECVLYDGTITLAGGQPALLLDCFGAQGWPTIDMGSGQSLFVGHYSGRIRLINKTGPDTAEISLNGELKIESSCNSAGKIEVFGVGKLIDNSDPAQVVEDFLLAPDTLATQLWEADLTTFTTDETMGHALAIIKQFLIYQQELGDGSTANLVIYDKNGTPVYEQDITDKDGNPIVVEPGVPARRSKYRPYTP